MNEFMLGQFRSVCKKILLANSRTVAIDFRQVRILGHRGGTTARCHFCTCKI